MATVQVYNDLLGNQYNIDITTGYSVLYMYGSGAASYYIRASTTQKTPGGLAVPVEIITDFPAPNFDVTEEIKIRCVKIMDEVSGGVMMSSSSSSSKSSSSNSSSSKSSSSVSSGSSLTSVSSGSSLTSVSSGSSLTSVSSETSISSDSSTLLMSSSSVIP